MTTSQTTAVLFIDQELATREPEAVAALATQLRLRGTDLHLVDGPPGHKPLLRAAMQAKADPATSWLLTADPAWGPAAATAGLMGLVMVDGPPPEIAGLITAQAESIVTAPLVMVPRGGGCWHAPAAQDS